MTRRRSTIYVIILCALVISGSPIHADIFQWEYINPADPSQGKQQSATLAPDGAGAVTQPGADLSNRNLTKAYLVGDLHNANLGQANLTDAIVWADLTSANLADAEVRGAHLSQISLAQLYSTASYQAHDLSGVTVAFLDLTAVNLASQNLAGGDFANASMAGANLSQSNAARGNFNRSILTNANLSYANFAGATFATVWADYFNGTDLTGANLSHANLTDVDFRGSTKVEFEGGVTYFPGAQLIGANLSSADARGAQFFLANLTDATTTNLIQSNGHIDGLNLAANAMLIVRDYDGNPGASPPAGLLPIQVDQSMAVSASGSLRMEFDADAWDSTISFAPGISVALAGDLQLSFAPGTDVAAQVGRTIDLFDWTGVAPTGTLTVFSPHGWDLTNLYTTGEVTLTSAGATIQGDFNGDQVVDAVDLLEWQGDFGLSDGSDADLDNDSDGADFLVWQRQLGGGPLIASMAQHVPEPIGVPVAAATLVVALASGRLRRR